jgi:hydroxymethylpyrimidine kinase / phosphomethylpyrimidine kinase / thiamine-phosphate diphosphorylase
MNEMELVICSLAQARERAGVEGEAPLLAQRLRERGAEAVCIVGASDGLDWIETAHARGWLGGIAQQPEEFERGMRDAMARGFVAADASVIAKMREPYALPSLSWGDGLTSAPTPALPRKGREQEAVPPSPSGGGSGWGRSAANQRGLGLYAIVDSSTRLRTVLEAGVRTVQLRIKKPASPDAAWHAMLRKEIQQAIAASQEFDAELFINDHWQLAHELGASAVHLGQEDLVALGEQGRAKLLASGMALGVSSHSLWELARARTLAPRYIACGPVWATITKDMPWIPQGLDNLAWWVRAAQAPVTAIGGILEPTQVEAVARTGVDGICIVRGLGDEPKRTLPAYEAALAAGRAQAPSEAPAWPHPSLPRD